MLFSEGKSLFTSFGDGNRTALLAHLWGDSPIRECREEMEGYAVEAYHLPQEHAEKAQVVSFVNGRRCEDPLFFGALKAGSPRPGGEWLFLLQVPEDAVDVNVHPAKIEVRFRLPRQVFRVLHRSVQRLGGDRNPLEGLSGEKGYSEAPRKESGGNVSFPWERDPILFPNKRLDAPFPPSRIPPSGETSSETFSERPYRVGELPRAPEKDPVFSDMQDMQDIPDLSELPRYMGRLASGYLLFDRHGDLVIMDPHAAHERVAYEEIAAMYSHLRQPQRLLIPLGLPPSLGERALEQGASLKKLGFLLEETEDGPVLSGIPESFGRLHISPPEGLRMALDVLEEMEEEDSEHLWKAWAFKACKAAVKLTDLLEPSEALELWKRLFACTHSGSCPHGRPTLLCYGADFLEKEFHRR